MRLNELKQHFSIRKLTIGAASVLIGTSFYLAGSQTVHADTINDVVKQTEQTPNVNESNNDKTNAENTNASNNEQVNSNSQVQAESNAQADKSVISDTNITNDVTSNDLNKESQTNNITTGTDKTAVTSDSHEQAGVDAVKYVDNGGYDSSIWGTMNVNDWTLTGNEITSYSGNKLHIIIPNSSDFIKAGKLQSGQTAEISKDTVFNLVHDADRSKATQSIAISLDDSSKIRAKGADWSYAFGSKDVDHSADLSNMQLSNLDVSNVTDMSHMFGSNQKLDLISLANWNVSNVTNMSYMFGGNQISDLTPLTNWNVSNVTNMSYMFGGNQISDLTPLTNWNVSNVTDMQHMFSSNETISDLTPLANWNVSNVTNMSYMFGDITTVKIGDLSNWSLSKIIQNPNIYPFSNSTGLDGIIDATSPAVIYIGDNTNLPSWFMQRSVNGQSNYNIFTTPYGGHLIVTSNPTLLANPNKAFNKVTFSDGSNASTAVFINAENNTQSILNVVNDELNIVIARKKADLEKANPDKTYILTIDPSVDQNDPIALSNAKINITTEFTADSTTEPELPTKQIIIYKNGNGNVVGTEDITGKPGDKVTPKIPDGYWTGDTSDVTIPDNGVITVVVTKKESSNGDSLVQPSIPAYTGDSTPSSDTPTDNASDGNMPANNSSNGNTPTGNEPSDSASDSDKVTVSNKGKTPTVGSAVRANIESANKQNMQIQDKHAEQELPQTGEKETSAASSFGLLALALGGLMGLAGDRKKKRN